MIFTSVTHNVGRIHGYTYTRPNTSIHRSSTSVPPDVQEFAFTKLPMNAGEFANLQCIVPTGDLPLNIRWSYPGEEMGGSSGVLAKKVADRVSMLMISVITAKHAGEYVCTAENAAGTASHSTVLTVNGSGLRSVPREHSLFHSSVAFYHLVSSLAQSSQQHHGYFLVRHVLCISVIESSAHSDPPKLSTYTLLNDDEMIDEYSTYGCVFR